MIDGDCLLQVVLFSRSELFTESASGLGLGELPKPLIYIAVALLLLGALPLPYGYYMILRIVACGVFAWAAFITYEKNEEVLPWVFGILAVLFNPILKIQLPKELWAVADVCYGILLLTVSKKIAANENRNP